jgi:hypothetical protein
MSVKNVDLRNYISLQLRQAKLSFVVVKYENNRIEGSSLLDSKFYSMVF